MRCVMSDVQRPVAGSVTNKPFAGSWPCLPTPIRNLAPGISLRGFDIELVAVCIVHASRAFPGLKMGSGRYNADLPTAVRFGPGKHR